jgi:hypothetical protein
VGTFDDIFKKPEIANNNPGMERLGDGFKDIVKDFLSGMNLDNETLIGISLLSHNKFFMRLFDFYIKNKKHVKGKMQKMDKELIEKVAECLAQGQNPAPLLGINNIPDIGRKR